MARTDPHDKAHVGHDPKERITRLCNVGLEAVQNDPEYLVDDKIAVLICNGVTLADWDRVEFGSGLYNYDSPREAVYLIVQHAQNIGEQYGVGIGIIDARIEHRPSIADILGGAIERALERMEKEERDNAQDQ